MEDLEEVRQEEDIEEQVFLDTKILSPDTKTVIMGFKRCMKMKTSRKIFFQPERTIKKEAGIETRM